LTPLLITLALFAAWWFIGLAVLVGLRADTASLRIALISPVLGTAVTLLPLFVLSHAGITMADGALPVAIGFLVCSAAILGVRRPKLPAGVLPIFAICIGGLVLAGRPMLSFGVHWIANATDDMANYVLSATQLLHHGLLAPLDVVGLSHDRDYATISTGLHRLGSRPGADIALAAFARVTGRAPYEVFMPFILALHMCMISGAAALAMQASRRKWSALVAAMLAAVSPLATYGALQQFLAQVWGLGLAAALLALIMRPELHRGRGAGISDVVPIGILVTALIAVYVELGSTLAVAYGLYLIVLALRREFDPRASARLWLPAVGIPVIILNAYLIREFQYVSSQAKLGLAPSARLSDFGFTRVPRVLPGFLGLQTLQGSSTAPWLGSSIAIAAVLLVGLLAGCLVSAVHGTAASVVLVVYAAFGAFLALNGGEFGLFHVYMYAQPFLAAAVAVWLFKIKRRSLFAASGALLAVLLAAQLSTQRAYVNMSRHAPGFHAASAPDLLPAFRRFFTEARRPVISVTENPAVAKLEAASIGDRSLYLVSQDIFEGAQGLGPTTGKTHSLSQWKPRFFDAVISGRRRQDRFLDNTHSSELLSTGRCLLVFPTGSQSILNRRAFPEGSPQLVARPCGVARNLIVFTASTLGQGFFDFSDRRAVSFYQLERDYFYPGHTGSGFGRYVLFRVLRPSSAVRLEINLTQTLINGGSNPLPPAALVGTRRESLPLVGRGSAHIFSAPFQAQKISGQAYLLLDLGRDAQRPPNTLAGVERIFGRSVVLDPRFLTSYVRNVSVVSDAEYGHLRRPSTLQEFPSGLANPNLEYSGIYEDGWVGENSYVVLAGGRAASLRLRAEVPAASDEQRLRVLVNGKLVVARKVAPGTINVVVPVPASRSPRRVVIRWAAESRLPAPERRSVSALLRFLGVVPRRSP
jgi:hypothetical protein